jgi:hypothetical protein
MPARTIARGKIVSRLPRGICKTREKDVGMMVINLAPRSIARHLSSVSGSSGGTTNASENGRLHSTLVLAFKPDGRESRSQYF